MSDAVDLFCAKEEDVRLKDWQEEGPGGEGFATWGPNAIPLCECKLMALVERPREALAIDKDAEMELMSFIRGLGRE